MSHVVFVVCAALRKFVGAHSLQKWSRRIRLFFSGMILIVLFQNCGRGFETDSSTSASNQANNNFDTPQLPYPDVDNPTIIQPKTQAGYVVTPANRVFFSGAEIAGIEVSSFKPLPGGIFATDQKRAYFQNAPILGAQPSSFRVLSGFFSTDEKTVFYKDLALNAVHFCLSEIIP